MNINAVLVMVLGLALIVLSILGYVFPLPGTSVSPLFPVVGALAGFLCAVAGWLNRKA